MRIKKLLRTLGAAGLLAAAISITALGEDGTVFVPGTSVNGLGISGMTVEEAVSHLEGFYNSSYALTIKKKNGGTETIKGSDIGYRITVPEGLSAILEQQNAAGRISGPAVDNSHTMEMQAVYDQQALENQIDQLNCIQDTSAVVTSNARISDYEEGQEFTIIPEVQGDDLDKEKTRQVIRDAVAAGLSQVDLQEAGCYYTVTVHADDPALTALKDTMNQYRTMTITYMLDGAQAEILNGETICSWLTVNEQGQPAADSAKIAEFVQSLAAKYDTAGTVRTFRTADGRDVELTGPYGWKVDQAAEVQALTALLASAQSQTRELSFSQTAASRTAPDWGTTYVEVDLAGQHVYMFQNGTLVWDAPCVTGNVSKNYTTPEGIYSLTYKEKDRILRGAKKADGSYEYESHVDYWMPFNGGIGLHDASWRSSFGGTIYQTSGSHGCINLPSGKAGALYDLVSKGMPVICHN